MPDTTEFFSRRERLLPILKEACVQAFLVTALPNIRYLSGFTGSNAALLLARDRALLFTDPRYAAQAPQESDCDVKIAKGALVKELSTWTKRLRLGAVAFEQNRISFEAFSQLQEHASHLRLKPITGAVERLRMTKSPAEIEAIRASVRLNSLALQQALTRLKPTMTELDLAAEIEYRMRRLGAEGTAFDTIIASGPHSALPHAHPTGAIIGRDQLLLIDMGANVAGYASDMTRTYVAGKPTRKARQMYGAVLESQLAAIDAVKPGVSCAAVDKAARDVLRKHGMDKLFVHSTGHGLGLEIHEFPRIGRKEKTKLEVGMAITIEPGAYDEAFGGVRIEDTVVVTNSGGEILTPTEKSFTVL